MISEESDAPQEPEIPPSNMSPLRTMLTEMHEIHRELGRVGFPQRTANGIIAHMILDAMIMRANEDDYNEDDDDDDEDDDYEEQLNG